MFLDLLTDFCINVMKYLEFNWFSPKQTFTSGFSVEVPESVHNIYQYHNIKSHITTSHTPAIDGCRSIYKMSWANDNK